MPTFRAKLSHVFSSVREDVTVEAIDQRTLRIVPAQHPESESSIAKGPFEVALSECTFRPPLGKIRRTIELPENRLLESDDLDVVDSIAAATNKGKGLRLVHYIESRWKLVVACIPVVIISVWATYTIGIPWAAKAIAFKLPASALEKASEGSTTLMDKIVFQDSELPIERQDEIREGFDKIIAALGTEGFEYDLHFRSMNDTPNAMALPSGDIFITDSLINKAEADEEIFAVLAHEVTHVEQRHGMRMVLQNSGVFFLSAVMLGDIASASSLAAGVPTMLIESGYSRDFENEADEGAAHYCVECGWTTSPMRTILDRIAPSGELEALGWISSHPDTAERVRRLMTLEAELSGLPAKQDPPSEPPPVDQR
jgi:Zn-dependent protease with chaperone function